MKLKLGISCHLLNVYTKFQIDISKHVEKRPEMGTDGRTDGHGHGKIRPFFKPAFKNILGIAQQHLINHCTM